MACQLHLIYMKLLSTNSVYSYKSPSKHMKTLVVIIHLFALLPFTWQYVMMWQDKLLHIFSFSPSLFLCAVIRALTWFLYQALSGVGEELQVRAQVTENTALTAALNTQFLFQIGIFTAVPMVLGFILEQGFLAVSFCYIFIWKYFDFIIAHLSSICWCLVWRIILYTIHISKCNLSYYILLYNTFILRVIFWAIWWVE